VVSVPVADHDVFDPRQARLLSGCEDALRVAVAVAGAVFALTIWVTRYISAGSIAAAVALTVTTVAMDAPAAVTVGTMIAAVIIIHRHRDNLARLLAGTERRVGQRL